jgi:hypothetical protein
MDPAERPSAVVVNINIAAIRITTNIVRIPRGPRTRGPTPWRSVRRRRPGHRPDSVRGGREERENDDDDGVGLVAALG